MKLDLTEIQNKRRETLEFEYEIDPDAADFALLPFGEAYAAPPRVRARAFDANGYVRVDFDAEAELSCECTRCLAEVRVPLRVTFRRYAGESANAAYGADDGDEADDVLPIVDSAIDADADVMEELALAAPEIVLCSDDCPGLCPRCGKKIGAGCICEPVAEEKPRDERLDVFRRLLEKMDGGENDG